MKYVYPAIFYKDKNLSDAYSVIFPDVEGAATCGYSLFEALEMAEDALCGMLMCWEDCKAKGTTFANKISAPTPIEKVIAEPDEFSSAAFVTLIKADTDKYREKLGETAEESADISGGKSFLMPRYDDDAEIPETLARELCRIAGVDFESKID